MKKNIRIVTSALVIGFLLTGFGFSALSQTAYAADATVNSQMRLNTSASGGGRDNMVPGSARTPGGDKSGIRADMKAEIKDEKAANMADKMKMFRENFSARFQMVIDRLVAINDRLSQITDRIESRLKKMSSEGSDVSASVKFVATAREELRLAKVSTDAASTSFKAESNTAMAATTTNENRRTVFAKTFANIQEAKSHLKKAHEALAQAVANAKAHDKKAVGPNTSVKTNTSAGINLGL